MRRVRVPSLVLLVLIVGGPASDWGSEGHWDSASRYVRGLPQPSRCSGCSEHAGCRRRRDLLRKPPVPVRRAFRTYSRADRDDPRACARSHPDDD
jgi:hypothetical protein